MRVHEASESTSFKELSEDGRRARYKGSSLREGRDGLKVPDGLKLVLVEHRSDEGCALPAMLVERPHNTYNDTRGTSASQRDRPDSDIKA